MSWLCVWLTLCAAPLPVIPVTIGQQHYHLEVAATEDERETGLMDRDKIGEHDGMLFLFREPGTRRFWMKNTRIPLDVIFLDKENRVLTTITGQPYSLAAFGPEAVGGNVIELDAGRAARDGIRPSDLVRYELPDTIRIR